MPGIPFISIVDDDDAHRSSLENLIRSVGLRAQGFSSAEAFLHSNHLQETRCLVLDVRMPGMKRPSSSVRWRWPNHLFRSSLSRRTKMTHREPRPLKLAPRHFCTNQFTRKSCSTRSMRLSKNREPASITRHRGENHNHCRR